MAVGTGHRVHNSVAAQRSIEKAEKCAGANNNRKEYGLLCEMNYRKESR